jgi:hypothetical protein
MNRRIYWSLALFASIAMLLIYFIGSSVRPAMNVATDDSRQEQRAPVARAGSSLLPAEYAIFQQRSPFGQSTGPVGAQASAGGPETNYVFRGAVQTGSAITAFFEEGSSEKVIQMMAGNSIASGRIKSIDLDAIEYESGGVSRRIEIGQNLKGQAAQPPAPTTAPSAPAPPGAGPPPNLPPGVQAQMQPPRHS